MANLIVSKAEQRWIAHPSPQECGEKPRVGRLMHDGDIMHRWMVATRDYSRVQNPAYKPALFFVGE